MPASGNDGDNVGAGNNNIESTNGDAQRSRRGVGGSESSIGGARTLALAALTHHGGNNKCTAGDWENDGNGNPVATRSSRNGGDDSVGGSYGSPAALNANPDFGRACPSPLLESADLAAGPS